MNIKNDIAIFLAARSGSKRLPNKHFLKLRSNLKSNRLMYFKTQKKLN